MKLASLIFVFILVIFTGCSNRNKDSMPVTEVKTEIATTTTTTTANVSVVTSSAETNKKAKTITTKVDSKKVTTIKKTTKATTSKSKPESTTKNTQKTNTKKKDKKQKKVLPVENIQQLPELPGGCEITSTAIVLNYYGLKCDKVELAENFLPMVQYPDEKGNWVSPWEAFVGSPQQGYYGCYSPVINKTINNFLKAKKITGYKVVDLSGSSFKKLYKQIDKDNPVIIWVSQDMVDINMNAVSWKLENGETFHWTRYEHCLVLIGYDLKKDTVYLSDPLNPKGTVVYPRKTVERVYKQVYKQALVIHKEV